MGIRYTGLPKEQASIFAVICATCRKPELRLDNISPVIADFNQKLTDAAALELAREHLYDHQYGPQKIHVPDADIEIDGIKPPPSPLGFSMHDGLAFGAT